MKNNFLIVAPLIGVFLLSGSGLMAQTQIGQPVSGVEDAALSSDQVKKLTASALNGSSVAAIKLANYYSSYHIDLEKGRYWAIIAAENGGPDGELWAWSYLHDSTDPLDNIRSLYWLRKAADSGSVRAQKKLKSMESEHR
jgi:TPR repeat protein